MVTKEKFDAKLYIEKYPDVKLSGIEPYEHFCKYGKVMGRSLKVEKGSVVKSKESPLSAYQAGNCYQDHLNISNNRMKGQALDATALRTGSHDIRKIYAWQATKRTGGLNDIYSSLEAYRDEIRKTRELQVLKNLDAEWSFKLAKIMAYQNLYPFDRLNAFTIYKYFFNKRRYDRFTNEHAKIFFDLALYHNDKLYLNKILKKLSFSKKEFRYIDTDRINPFAKKDVVQRKEDLEKWLVKFNEVFSSQSIEPVKIVKPTEKIKFIDGSNVPAFDYLYSSPNVTVKEGPKVTVVISVWEPDQGLVTAVKSIINQSWFNIEILIVDDCCEEKYREVIDYCVSLDPRIKYFRQPVNQGTYMARNLAMDKAEGDFITFHDADDWCHPRRVEKQVAEMLNDSSIMATTSKTIRVRENLLFSYIGYPLPERLNTSSIMFRLGPVKSKIGYYDSVRKGADSEYLKRLQIVFGDKAYLPLDSVLSIVRLGEISLSRSEFRAGWHHPAREAYKGAYSYWHDKIAKGESPYRENSISKRQFPTPDKFSIEKRHAKDRMKYDVIFIGDWRGNGGPQNSMLSEIKALLKSGLKVAVCHLEALRFMTKQMLPLNSEVQTLINDFLIDQINLFDNIHAGLVICRYPPIFQFIPAIERSITVDSAILVANQSPREQDGSDLRYEVHECIKNAKLILGVDPLWVPQGPAVREVLAPLLPQHLLSTHDMGAIIDVAEWQASRPPFSYKQPVIGRYSRDNYLKFPSNKRDLTLCYPVDDTIKVKIMGGRKTCSELLGSKVWPKNWNMYKQHDIPVKSFLNDIDFFVHFDHELMIEAFGRSVLEALASGRVVILPYKFQKVFKNAAIYCNPEDVIDVVKKYSNNLELYKKQSELGVAYVVENFSEAAFKRKIVDFQH